MKNIENWSQEKIQWLLDECIVPSSTNQEFEPIIHIVQTLRNSLSDVLSNVSVFMETLENVAASWNDIPYMGERPEFSAVFNSSMNGKGEMVISWSPFFKKTHDVNSCKNMMMFNFGKTANELKVPSVKILANYLQNHFKEHDKDTAIPDEIIFARNHLWALSFLPTFIQSIVPSTISSSLGSTIAFDYKCKLSTVDHAYKAYEKLMSWISHYDSNQVLPMDVLIYLSKTTVNPQDIRDVSKVKYGREMSFSDARLALSMLSQIDEYNSSKWRKTRIIALPEASPPEKQIPTNKTLIQKDGKKPRVSPIAIRGTEGSNIVQEQELKNTISQRIDGFAPDYHFTAGDFSDLVSPGGRSVLLGELTKLRQKNEITSIYKGVYSKSSKECDPVSALNAIMRDRGELIVSAKDRALVTLGVQGNPLNPPLIYYTNGPLRNFSACGVNIKLLQEKVPELCKTALTYDNPDAFVLVATSILDGFPSNGLIIDVCERNGYIFELEEAQRFCGRFI